MLIISGHFEAVNNVIAECSASTDKAPISLLHLLDLTYLSGATKISVTDPYLRMFHQQRNLMELLETISKVNDPGHEVSVHVLTAEDEFGADKQVDNFQKMADACASIGITFTWEFDRSGKKHDRDITTDTGWKIVLSRGLDVFQRYELNEAFSFSNRLQQHRQCKEFNVTYVRIKK